MPLSPWIRSATAEIAGQARRTAVNASRQYGGMRFGSQALNDVPGLRTVRQLITMHPDAKLEGQAASDGLLADEAQHREVALALAVGEVGHAYRISGNVDQEGIQEQEVAVGDVLQEVVAEAEGEMQPVEARAGERSR